MGGACRTDLSLLKSDVMTLKSSPQNQNLTLLSPIRKFAKLAQDCHLQIEHTINYPEHIKNTIDNG